MCEQFSSGLLTMAGDLINANPTVHGPSKTPARQERREDLTDDDVEEPIDAQEIFGMLSSMQNCHIY